MGLFLKNWGRWMPFALGVLWLTGEGMAGSLRVDLFHLWLCGLTGAAWLFAQRLYLPAVLVLVLLAPLSLRLGALLPLENHPPGEWDAYTRVEGTVRGRGSLAASEAGGGGSVRRGGAWLLLGEARVWRGGEQFRRAELEVRLPGVSHWRVPYRRRVRIGGWAAPSSSFLHGPLWARPRVDFLNAEHHIRWEPLSAWRGESLRARLRDRAAYYLSPRALAVYLPVVLGIRERATPEAREVARAFRRVGVAHLFAISGLHVGLLYWIFAGVLRWMVSRMLGRVLPDWVHRGGTIAGQGWVRAPGAIRGAALAVIWVYIALIGFPISAVRAALMVSMLVWNAHWGTRSPPLFVLALAGLGMLAFAPSQLHDISFQMSFLAYFFLLCGLSIYQGKLPAVKFGIRFAVKFGSRFGKGGATGNTENSGEAAGAEGARETGKAGRTLAHRIPHPVLPHFLKRLLHRTLRRVGEGVSINLWLTLLITLGLWPLAGSVFGNLSLLVFFGNLLMIPPLSFAVLPLGLMGLFSTLLCLNAAPGNWLERAIFAGLEPVLSGWVWLAQQLDRLGSGLVFRLELAWPVQAYFAYYVTLLLLIGWVRRWKGRTAGTEPDVPGP